MVIFWTGRRIGLLGRYQRVADLMIGYNHLFLIGHNGVLFLIAGNNHFDAFLQICLRCTPFVPSRTARRAASLTMLASSAPDSAGGHPGNVFKVNIGSNLDFLSVNLQNLFSAFQIRQFNRNPAVKTARTGQSRDQGIPGGWSPPE